MPSGYPCGRSSGDGPCRGAVQSPFSRRQVLAGTLSRPDGRDLPVWDQHSIGGSHRCWSWSGAPSSARSWTRSMSTSRPPIRSPGRAPRRSCGPRPASGSSRRAASRHSTVALVVADEVDEEAAREIRALRRQGVERIVLLVARLDDQGLLIAVEAGVCGVLRRSDATAGNIRSTIRSVANGEGTLPPDLLGRLLDQVGRLQRQVLAPRGLTFRGLTEREVSVLRLLADGKDTAEVGQGAVLLRADGQEHRPRHHQPPGAAQPDPRRGLRHQAGPHLARRASPLPRATPRAGRSGPSPLLFLVLGDLLALGDRPPCVLIGLRPACRWADIAGAGAGAAPDITRSALAAACPLVSVGLGR